ncbi:MAG: glucuronate isomerase [Planctomycetota bacterium]|nr:glucuronate isomerase [Planctomycetaceae bacterium]MDQ3331727.1 glucuronate isomerase [Planctomycetota bacterium]
MSQHARDRLFGAIDELVLIDPHTHVNPHAPASSTLADILGYHYYTELAHSAGMPKDRIEEPGLDPREKVGRLAEYLDRIDNTVQLSWLFEMSRTLFDVEIDRFTRGNWETLYDAAQKKFASPDWENEVLKRSKVEKVFLTNDFDDPLEGFDANRYVPCLRTDDLVFHLSTAKVHVRLAKATGIEVGDASSLRQAIGKLFEHFVKKGARACAISLPPRFTPDQVDVAAFEKAFRGLANETTRTSNDAERVESFVFWTLAEMCDAHKLPFDLMIGVNRAVYPQGVHQGMDLYDSRVSLIQYRALFNAFPNVTFPISVLAPTSNQELVSYAWIFPNVVTNGHWWYSNIPCHIANDLRARLEAVPKTKQIGYYSDAYKLEFIQPKFAMYKRILADVLFEEFVVGRKWGEERAIGLGRTILRGNVERVFDV